MSTINQMLGVVSNYDLAAIDLVEGQHGALAAYDLAMAVMAYAVYGKGEPTDERVFSVFNDMRSAIDARRAENAAVLA